MSCCEKIVSEPVLITLRDVVNFGNIVKALVLRFWPEVPSLLSITLPSICLVKSLSGKVNAPLQLSLENFELVISSLVFGVDTFILVSADAVTIPNVTPPEKPAWLPLIVTLSPPLALIIPPIVVASTNSTSIFLSAVAVWFNLPNKLKRIVLFSSAVSKLTVGCDWSVKSIMETLSLAEPSVSPALALPDATVILPVPWFDQA